MELINEWVRIFSLLLAWWWSCLNLKVNHFFNGIVSFVIDRWSVHIWLFSNLIFPLALTIHIKFRSCVIFANSNTKYTFDDVSQVSNTENWKRNDSSRLISSGQIIFTFWYTEWVDVQGVLYTSQSAVLFPHYIVRRYMYIWYIYSYR